MTEHKLGKLEVVVDDTTSECLSFQFRGESDASDAAANLRALFDQYFARASERGISLDFSGLTYMNSSTFPPIVELIRRLHEAGAKIEVIYSQHKAWQRTPFSAISAIAAVYPNLTVRAC